MTDEDLLRRRLERELLARKEAEAISEEKISELYQLNRQLEKTLEKQKKISAQLQKRTRQLERKSIKLAEEHKGRNILQNILESSIEYSIISVDLKGKILLWNEGARLNYGYTASEILNKNIRKLHLPKDVQRGNVKSFFDTAYKEGKAERIFERVRKDGSIFTASVTMTIRSNKDGAPVGYVIISKDITKAKEIEERLKKSNEELEQFAYIVSHDLKAPLRAIMQLSSWIEEDNQDNLDNDSKKNLQLLHERADRMSKLIDGILQYSRAGRMNLEISEVDVKLLLEEIIETIDPNKQFVLQLPQSLPVFNTALIPLSQVFSNLISNALKHHHRKKGHLVVGAHEAGDYYEFFVKDDGPGIKNQDLEKIFKLFQTLTPQNGTESTGIGLSIVKKIVESQNGVVKVKSELGKGSCFSFTWPKTPHPMSESSK
ncbi:sensor histidine kinase [Legionella impletisoli]|uniref:histidine kinase n=3 Tax=Bacteria TaxID=2 RepID=A0A917JSD6_9GAMM|nr:PAS domain-containing sensor histidine kinase [Legionella impletisoli]GGI84016.1 PAS domain-containing sensor histidine kinase [Legionella impletisoli]